MRAGTRRLLLREAPNPAKIASESLDTGAKLALSHNPYGSVDRLFEDCASAVADLVIDEAGGPAWDQEGFARLVGHARERWRPVLADVLRQVAAILTEAHAVARQLEGSANLQLLPSLTDAREQLGRLVHRGFVSDAGAARLPDILRYLRSLSRRLDKLPEDPVRDRDRMGVVRRLEEEYTAALARLPEHRRHDDDVRAVHWMLQELRVSLFAQGLGTAYPVSEKRVRKALAELTS